MYECYDLHNIQQYHIFHFSYVRFSQLCAQAVRSGLKRDLQAEAEKRNAYTIKHIPWKDGKAVSKCRIFQLVS